MGTSLLQRPILTRPRKTKSPASLPGFAREVLRSYFSWRTGSGRLQIASSLLAALGDDLVGDLLTFVERAHTGALHSGDVHEHILRAVIRLDESIALLGIEELHSSDRHQTFLSRFLSPFALIAT